MEAYARTEAILKDLLRFYICLFLKVQNRLPFEEEQQFEAVEKFVREELGFKFGPSDMNLGQLIQAFNKVDSVTNRDSEFVELLQSHFGRNCVSPGGLKPIEVVLPKRKLFGHDAEGHTTPNNVPDSRQCLEILSQLLEFASFLEKEGIYPRVVRFVAEVRDEYGRRYLDAVDEEGQRWRIKAQEFVHMEASYFMQPVTTPVATYPLLIEKLA